MSIYIPSPEKESEQNLAMNLMDDGRRLHHANRCDCEQCQLNIEAAIQRLGRQHIALAKALFSAQSIIQLRAMIENWDRRTIASVVIRNRQPPDEDIRVELGCT